MVPNDTETFIMFLSCFVSIKIQEELRTYTYNGKNKSLSRCLEFLEKTHNKYYDISTREIGYINEDAYFYQYDLIYPISLWLEADTEIKTKQVLQNIQSTSNIFAGEFIKAILKINAIAIELENVCDMTNNISLKNIIHSVPSKLLKYIATNQSLYI